MVCKLRMSFLYRRSVSTFSSKTAINMQHGDYRITVITPVCGTGNSGSIPGSRPNENIFVLRRYTYRFQF